MKKMMRIAAMAVLVLGVAAMLQPANAICANPRAFSSGGTYILTPGCTNNCGANNTSLTDNAVGTFWAIGDGDPTIAVGIDNGTFPLLGGWAYVYPGYPATLNSTWAADAGIDGCIDFAADPQRCMAVLLMDANPDTGEGVFALITKEPDAIGNYDLDLGAPVDLTGVPGLSITGSVRTGGGTGVDVSVDGLSLTDIEGGLYLDPNCPQPSGGGIPGVILGYQVFEREVGRDAPAPDSSDASMWNAVGPVTPLGDPTTVSLGCSGDTDRYITTGLIFDSNFQNVWLSSNSTKLHCGSTLAEPDIDIERKPRNRETPRSRTKGR